MKRFFDSTIFVAAVLEDHQHHEPSFSLFASANRQSAFCAAHSLAEVYAALTRYPGKRRLSADQASLAIAAIEARSTIVALDAKEYLAMIRHSALLGISGGTVYDALIAACAMKANVDILYTWNAAHFLRLGDDVARKVRTPLTE